MTDFHAEAVLSESERQRIREHLDHLLESSAFAGSRRRQAFLRYVVEEALAGRRRMIKETTIAINVFGRDSDFDTQHASIVRVTGGEVRKRLAQAYSEMSSDVRIELPVGSYQPVFHLPEAGAQAVERPDTSAASVPETQASGEPVPDLPVPEAPAEAPEPVMPRRYRRRWIYVAAGALLASLGLAALASTGNLPGLSASGPIDRLWKPFISDYRPVLLAVETARVLNLQHRDRWLPLRPGEMIPTSELEQLESGYVGTGGAVGAVLFGRHLASRDQHFVLKFGEDVSYADLRSSPAILIGPSRWALDLTRPLRFRMIVKGRRMEVTDSQNPGQTWGIERVAYPEELPEGYSLVTRLISAETGLPALVILGMDSRNTQAAVEFLSDEASFSSFTSDAPADWDKRNFQIVLYNKIHGHSPAALRVVASHVW